MKAALKDIEGAKKGLEKKKAALQMEKALAEVSETAGALNTKFDVSTDIGSILTRVDDQIHKARARSKVASDLSDQGSRRSRPKAEAEKAHAREVLQQFKVEQGLAEPAAAPRRRRSGPREQTLQKSEEG